MKGGGHGQFTRLWGRIERVVQRTGDSDLPAMHMIDLVALGADPTGQVDATAAVQAALDLAMKGDGTATITLPPKSRILCLGQFVVHGSGRNAETGQPRGTGPGDRST